MLNHKKQSEGTGTLKPKCLVTVAMIYEANSDGTIFSLERRTSNQPPLLQLSELNAQWLMLMLMCLLHIQTPNLNCRCQSAHGGHRCTLLYSNNMVKEWITLRGQYIHITYTCWFSVICYLMTADIYCRWTLNGPALTVASQSPPLLVVSVLWHPFPVIFPFSLSWIHTASDQIK